MKRTKLLIATLILSLIMSFTSFAGQWKQDKVGWWYQNDDQSYPKSAWQLIDAKWYYFGADGYMLANTVTPDGYSVGADGALIEKVANQAVQSTSSKNSASSSVQSTTSKSSTSSSSSLISSTPFEGYTIVVNTNTKKYHFKTCSSVSKIASHNIGYSNDAEGLNALRYSACKRCH